MGEEVVRVRRRAPVLALLVLLLGGAAAGGWWLLRELPRRRAVEQRRRIERCRDNLERIVVACRLFHDGEGEGQRFPYDLQELVDRGLLDAGRLRCPVDPRGGERASYTYLGRQPMLVSAGQFILAYETFHNHRKAGRPEHMAAFADQRVQWISTSELQELLRRQSGGPDR